MPSLVDGPVRSRDGAARYVLASEGASYEAVHYTWPHRGIDALCISAQAGCGFGCRHCATTFAPVQFQRSLTADEMVETVRLVLADRVQTGVRTVDVSGIGDPSRNWEAVAEAGTRLLADRTCQRVTVTTVAPQRWVRQRLAGGWLPAKVRISLHGATHEVRRRVVTFGDDPVRVIDHWEQLAERVPVELNYVLHAGNTAESDARDLVGLLAVRRFACLRLSPLNPVAGSEVQPAPDPGEFVEAVRAGLPDWVIEEFRPLGGSAEAACGQLRVRAEG